MQDKRALVGLDNSATYADLLSISTHLAAYRYLSTTTEIESITIAYLSHQRFRTTFSVPWRFVYSMLISLVNTLPTVLQKFLQVIEPSLNGSRVFEPCIRNSAWWLAGDSMAWWGCLFFRHFQLSAQRCTRYCWSELTIPTEDQTYFRCQVFMVNSQCSLKCYTIVLDDTYKVAAVIDTGAEDNLLSERFCVNKGFEMSRTKKEFYGPTSGYMEVVGVCYLSVRYEDEEIIYTKIPFYIVRDLTCDALLSCEFLELTGAVVMKKKVTYPSFVQQPYSELPQRLHPQVQPLRGQVHHDEHPRIQCSHTQSSQTSRFQRQDYQSQQPQGQRANLHGHHHRRQQDSQDLRHQLPHSQYSQDQRLHRQAFNYSLPHSEANSSDEPPVELVRKSEVANLIPPDVQMTEYPPNRVMICIGNRPREQPLAKLFPCRRNEPQYNPALDRQRKSNKALLKRELESADRQKDLESRTSNSADGSVVSGSGSSGYGSTIGSGSGSSGYGSTIGSTIGSTTGNSTHPRA